ncbi:hypothetical protein J2Z48_002644 [Croceifilum oryzae]|uniref:Uncharacterized protein n=1 Tax=Croceifilum oryzae TaxID=1553429 RepID=A0AAJ1WRF0_9BACL|nr:hypothetical protein [Croceifilum oryzae]
MFTNSSEHRPFLFIPTQYKVPILSNIFDNVLEMYSVIMYVL